jgi:hypothetical protein
MSSLQNARCLKSSARKPESNRVAVAETVEAEVAETTAVAEVAKTTGEAEVAKTTGEAEVAETTVVAKAAETTVAERTEFESIHSSIASSPLLHFALDDYCLGGFHGEE